MLCTADSEVTNHTIPPTERRFGGATQSYALEHVSSNCSRSPGGVGIPSSQALHGIQHQCTANDWICPILSHDWAEGKDSTQCGLRNSMAEALSPNEFASPLTESFRHAYQQVRDRTGGKLKRQKELYDRKVHGEPFLKGDLVWLVPQHCHPLWSVKEAILSMDRALPGDQECRKLFIVFRTHTDGGI